MKDCNRKRAVLFNLWRIAIHVNDESLYYSTLGIGVPDGETPEGLMQDLKYGLYDDDLDGIIELYKNVITIAEESGSGFYVRGSKVSTAEEVIEIEDIELINKIYLE